MSFHLATRHLPRLDSVRGLAALMVAATHSYPAATVAGSLVGVFADGRIAVTIFFVLSGLVLGMSLRRAGPLTPSNYWSFVVRRFFRIYPAYVVCTLPYLFLQVYLTARAIKGEFIGQGMLNEHYRLGHAPLPSLVETLKNFCFLSQGLNGVTWTLKVEAIAALLLPFLHWYSSVFRWKGKLVMLLALILISVFSRENTRVVFWLFYCGYLLPPLLKKLTYIPWQNERLVFFLLLLAALSALVASHTFYFIGYVCLPAGVGAVLLLAAILTDHDPHTSLFRFLDLPILRFLGAISYSFYLLNIFSHDAAQRIFSCVPALMFLDTNQTNFSLSIVFAAGVTLTVALATLSNRLVERPFIRLGGYLTNSNATNTAKIIVGT